MMKHEIEVERKRPGQGKEKLFSGYLNKGILISEEHSKFSKYRSLATQTEISSAH